MKKKRKALLLVLVAVVIILSTIGIVLFGQTPSSPATTQSSGPEESPPGETPPNLLVIPEVPIGTLAILAACFFALIVSQMKHKAKLQ